MVEKGLKMTKNDLLKSYLQELYPAEVKSKASKERWSRFLPIGISAFLGLSLGLSAGNIGAGERSRKAKAGAIAIMSLMTFAIAFVSMRMEKCVRRCRGVLGKEKTLCVLKCREATFLKIIADSKAAKVHCKKAEDPVRCLSKLDDIIEKYSMDLIVTRMQLRKQS